MNELQVALVVIGVVAVAGILIYNRIQERKFRRQAEAGFSRPYRDALMGDENPVSPARRVEPELRETGNDVSDSGLQEGMGVSEPHFGTALEASDIDTAPQGAKLIEAGSGDNADVNQQSLMQSNQQAVHKENATPLSINPMRPRSPVHAIPDPITRPAAIVSAPHDDLIEYQIRLKSEGILAGVFNDAINQARAFSKPVRWMGLPSGSHVWEELLPWSEKHYQEVLVAMQLADRNGAVSEEMLSGLCNLVRDAASPHGIKVLCNDIDESLDRARSLDMFCVDVDVLIGLNVVARGDETLPMSRVRLEAGNAGMMLASDGTFQLTDSRGEVIYSLCNHESTPFSPEGLDTLETHGVTLLFDVPRVPDGIKNFNGMVALGRKLAHEAGGLLVDDNLRPLTDAGIEKIRAQLTQIYNKMESRGIPAGGRLALKLFS
jgi:FtsZ-interacting cell division protein ZipA